MKLNLRFRGCYCPKRIQPLCRIIVTVFLISGVGGKVAFGKKPLALPNAISAIRIGDTIPEYLWHLPLRVVNHPDGKEKIRLSP